MSPITFVHGWGMGPEIWSPLLHHLPGIAAQRADLGFRGTPARPLVTAPLVVTHSLGLMWALENLPRPWAGLVAVNGFTRFSRTESFPGVEPRLLARMKAKLDSDAAAVVGDFLRRCGHPSPDGTGWDRAALTRGLDQLERGDGRAAFTALDCPQLIIAGQADPIVAPGHTQACFAQKPLVMIEGAGHMLPLTHTSWLASRLAGVLNGDWSA